MEIGKYYVDGEGFYKVLNKEVGYERLVIVDAVLCQKHSIAHYHNLPYREEACDRRMMECTKEQFEEARDKADAIIAELYEFNTKVFRPLWDKKVFY